MDPVKTASAVRLFADLCGRITNVRQGETWEITVRADGSGCVSCYEGHGYDPDPLVVVSFGDPDNLPEVLEKLGIVSEDDGG